MKALASTDTINDKTTDQQYKLVLIMAPVF